jgi:hypothetical protein
VLLVTILRARTACQDELLWGSAWLLWATKNTSYLADVLSLGANDGVDMFSWDNKLAGARVLLSRVIKTHRTMFPPVPSVVNNKLHLNRGHW